MSRSTSFSGCQLGAFGCQKPLELSMRSNHFPAFSFVPHMSELNLMLLKPSGVHLWNTPSHSRMKGVHVVQRLAQHNPNAAHIRGCNVFGCHMSHGLRFLFVYPKCHHNQDGLLGERRWGLRGGCGGVGGVRGDPAND